MRANEPIVNQKNENMIKCTGLLIGSNSHAIHKILDILQGIIWIDIRYSCKTMPEARSYLEVNYVDFIILDAALAMHRHTPFLQNESKSRNPLIIYISFTKDVERLDEQLFVDLWVNSVRKRALLELLQRLNMQWSANLAATKVCLEHQEAYLLLRGPVRNQRRLIEWKNIVYIMMEYGKVIFYLLNGIQEESGATFQETKNRLPKEWFIHCAQGVLFNRQFFHRYLEGQVELTIKRKERYISLPVDNKEVYSDFYRFLDKDAMG